MAAEPAKRLHFYTKRKKRRGLSSLLYLHARNTLDRRSGIPDQVFCTIKSLQLLKPLRRRGPQGKGVY